MSAAGNSDSGKESMSSGGSRSTNMSYCAFDYGLVVLQRLLICFSAIIGYDLLSAPSVPPLFFVGTVMRIVRNFFFITKAVRKWLAINYNDGVIPQPPVHCIRPPTRLTRRSTPLDSRLTSQLSGGLKHSPINHRYNSVKNYDLATALKERHNGSDGIEHRYYADSHSSDFLAHSSSISLRFVLNGLARSFTGCLEDPDEEMMNTHREDIDSAKKNLRSNESESRHRNEMVVESVLENDALLKQNAISSGQHAVRVPLPAPVFDETTTSFIPHM